MALSLAATTTSTALGTPDGSPREGAISFGLITDIQYADADPAGERHFRESIPKLATAVDALAARRLPFTLHLGDLIDEQFASFPKVLALLERLGHPVRHLLGNHDFSVTPEEKPLVSRAMGMPADYYAFTHADLRFIMLDSNDVSTYKHADDSPLQREAAALMARLEQGGRASAKPWNGGISKTQIHWLETELKTAATANQRAILCSHHPLLPADGYQIWNADEVLDVIDQHPSVIACFNGHNHAGAETIRNGIPFITFKSMLHQPGITAYSVLHLTQDSLRIEGFGREQSRTVPLRSRTPTPSNAREN